MGLELFVIFLRLGSLLIGSQVYLDSVSVCSCSRDSYPANVLGVRMALKGLFYSASDLLNVGYLELSVNYAGEIKGDARKLLLI